MIPEDIPKGIHRESNLPKSRYFDDSYFSLEELFSLSNQIHHIYQMKPSNLIEIGIGNGFTSSFLRLAGFPVYTVDINPNLEPDACVPLSQLVEHLNGRRFDLAVCCEVLEHMPFDQFDDNLRTLATVADRLFLTLPNNRIKYGFEGTLSIPKIGLKRISTLIETDRRRSRLSSGHFWEVGSSRETAHKQIVSRLQGHYREVMEGTFFMVPYHVSFSCKK